MSAKLHILRETNLLDIPAMLRRWADDIEAGEHGTPHGCVFVLDADKLDVAYFGTGEAAPNAMMLLQCGIAALVEPAIRDKT